MNPEDTTSQAPISPKQSRKAAVGALAGTSLEFYDFYVYATASALVFGALFFPVIDDPFVATMAAFAVFGVGFVSRPLGAVIFGHFGDKYGRKRTLIASLLIMGGSTFLVGFLPTYDTAGVAAPLALVVLRLLQGFAIGGEWGGAALISTESAPRNRRNFYGAFTQLGSPVGTVMASGMFALAGLGGHEVLLDWAWRVPFWFSGLLVIVGLVIRVKLEESPAFTAATQRQHVVRMPIVTVLREQWRSVLAGVAAVAVGIGGFYITGTLFLSYATTQAGNPESPLLLAQTIAAATSIISFPLFALLADRIGSKPVMISGLVATYLVAAPHFLVANTKAMVLIGAMLVVTQTVQSGAWVCIPAFLSRAFPPETRYTGISLSYQLASILFGGIMPIVGAGLLASNDGNLAPAIVLLVLLATINIGGVIATSRIIAGRERSARETTTQEGKING